MKGSLFLILRYVHVSFMDDVWQKWISQIFEKKGEKNTLFGVIFIFNLFHYVKSVGMPVFSVHFLNGRLYVKLSGLTEVVSITNLHI